MNYSYETCRLSIRLLEPAPQTARQTLDFYSKNRIVFEQYEAMRPEKFYTPICQKAILSAELDLALRQKCFRFWIYEKNRPTHIIGTICFYNIVRTARGRCETGYKFDPRYWHKGYAREAMQFGIELMSGQLDIHRIEAFVVEENAPSIRLLQSLDFRYEGICQKAIKIQSAWREHMLFAHVR